MSNTYNDRDMAADETRATGGPAAPPEEPG
jgi:hypothetical protein